MNEETRCTILARQHDTTARALRKEAEMTSNTYLKACCEAAAQHIQQLGLAYVATAEEARRATN